MPPPSLEVAKAPLVSVVIPVRNREHLVTAAIESVLAQTHPAIEVVVVDDGSTDGTRAVLARLAAADPRIVMVVHEASRGAQAARNTGIRASHGEWVTFLDSDDRYLPESVVVRLAEASKSGALVVHSEGRRITADGIEPTCGVPPLWGNVHRELLTAPAVLFPTLLVRLEVLVRIGYLDEAIAAWQEWETAIRLGEVAAFGFVAEPTFDYDARTVGAISRDAARAAKGYAQIVAKHRRAILRKAGWRVLAHHYRTMYGLRVAAHDRVGAIRCGVLSVICWPPSLRLAVRAVVRQGR